MTSRSNKINRSVTVNEDTQGLALLLMPINAKRVAWRIENPITNDSNLEVYYGGADVAGADYEADYDEGEAPVYEPQEISEFEEGDGPALLTILAPGQSIGEDEQSSFRTYEQLFVVIDQTGALVLAFEQNNF